MAVGLLLLVLVAASVWAVARSTRKLRMALIGIGVMMVTELIALATIILLSLHAGHSRHALGWDAGFGGMLALPVAILFGSIATLITSAKYRKPSTSEVSL